MRTFKDFLDWYNYKDVVPTLEAMLRIVDFYHNKGIDMLQLGCAKSCNYLSSQILLQSSITSQGATSTDWRKFEMTWLVDHPMHLQGMLLWTKLLYVVRQNCAEVLLELMLVSAKLSLCVKQGQLVCTLEVR